MRRLIPLLLTALAAATTGCSEEELPGHYFLVELESKEDNCNDPEVTAREEYLYRLVVDGAQVSIFVDEALLATGALNGCDLNYRSVTFTEDRGDADEYTVRWSVAGDAKVSLGDACDAGDGWVGEERIDIVNSTDPDLAPGCTYRMDAIGSYQGEVK